MNQETEAANSNAQNLYVMKRKRGRPRKDKSHQAETIDFRNGGMLGQPVNGVIESTFDAGYLLNIRIGNSSSNYRGLVFKPGNILPIMPSIDIAPHAQMIKRIDVHLQRERFEINGGSDSSDKDVVVAAEPLSVLLPIGSQSSDPFMAAKTDKLPLRRSSQNANDSCGDGISQGTKIISFSQGIQHM